MKKNLKIDNFQQRLNVPEAEEMVLEYWKENKSFEKSVKLRSEEKSYEFFDGPPFATGMPHYGHLLASTIKDVVPRYWTMKGYRVERVWGWDCHGLPIENMIEKSLNLKGGKKGIEDLGIDKFNSACRNEVLKLDKEWEKIIGRLGRWVDFKNNYKTMDKDYMESVWWAFKTLDKKGLVNEGKRVILYCPRCATPLSNFEIAMDNSYQDKEVPSTVYKYKLKNKDNTYLLAWSTTPWNKLATPALVANPSLEYVKVKQADEYYILAKDTLEMLKEESKYEVIETFKGAELDGVEFELHYDFYPERDGKRAGVVVVDDYVTSEEGTGIVTLAVYGEDDYRVMLKENIQLVEHVDDQGMLKKEVAPWAGMFMLKANKYVNEDLKNRNLIYKNKPKLSSVPTCYRCETRLYHAPLPAWFIDVQKIKSQMIDQNENINWYPGHLKKGRFGKGLETAPDWNISRSRYWGTPMPVWKSDASDKKRIIGSIEELQQWAVEPKEVENLTDIHREFIDHIKVWVDDEKTEQGTRIPEVFDCWVESGSMPYASLHYPFENKEKFESEFPAEFIAEYIAQTRAWFYTLHVLSVGLFGKNTFENAVTTGNILAEDGAKMSKSKKNYPDPTKLIDQYGVDSLRLYLMSSPVMKAENMNFSDKEVSDIKRKVFTIWWNVFVFYQLYADKSQPLTFPKSPKDIMDSWLVSRTETLTKEYTKLMDEYNVVSASRKLMEYTNELSTWYLRRSRERLRGKDNKEVSQVFGAALYRLTLLFAPFTPFYSELMYQNFKNGNDAESVHHELMTEHNNDLIDSKLEEEMTLLRKVVEATHAQRQESGFKLKQPLAKVSVSCKKLVRKDLFSVLKDEVNVVDVLWDNDTSSENTVTTSLDTTLTNDLKKMGQAREIISQIQKQRKKLGVTYDQQVIVELSEWPEEHEEEIKQKVLARKLVKAEEFKVTPA
ncbi:isoleucine--tRNA ligase [Patescibacteria group bacterium]